MRDKEHGRYGRYIQLGKYDILIIFLLQFLQVVGQVSLLPRAHMRSRGNVISLGVHIIMYICVCTNKFCVLAN